MALLFDEIKNFCSEKGFDQTYWVAYSGGLDSTVLLHLLWQVRHIYPLTLHAIHVHHGLSPNANQWSLHCKKNCEVLQIPYVEKNIDTLSFGQENLEAIAREKRYELFKPLLAPHDFLLTAHHQDDQAETLLLQLLRGAGLKGLAAMPSQKLFGQGFHLRPLLQVDRASLKAYAIEHQLTWIEDESNDDTQLRRNYLRHEVMPVLKKYWPAASLLLSRTAEHVAEAQSLLDEVAVKDLAECQGKTPNSLSIEKLLLLHEARQRQVLRVWLQQLHFSLPSVVKMQEIQKILQAKKDKLPVVHWRGVELRRYQGQLYAIAPLDKKIIPPIEWDLKKPLLIPGVGELLVEEKPNQGLRQDISSVTIRFRAGGERCHLPNRACHHRLKKLFQQWQVPPWERNRVPLIYVKDRLVGAVGYFLDDEFCVRENEKGRFISLKA